jgi:ATP-binding cassette subfamily B protein
MSTPVSGADVSRQGWIRRLSPWLRPHRRNVILAFGSALVGSGISAAVPAIQREVIDNVILVHRSALAPWLILLFVLAGVSFASAYVRRYRGGRVSLDVQYDLRNAIYDQLQRLDFARHDQMQTGQLVSRANSDVGLLQGLLAFLPIMIGNVLLLVASLVIMFVLSPLLGVLSLLVVPGLVFTAYRMREVTFPANWEAQQREGEVAVVVEEAITGVRVVKGFGQEARELDHLVQRAQILYGSRLRAVRYQARYQPLLQSIPVFGQVAVLALGGYLALHHRISIGTFLAFATYLIQLSAPARMLAGVLLVAQQARAGAERVLDLLDTNPLVTERPDALVLPSSHGEVVFDDVRFGYAPGEPVLDHFNLQVAAGETVALVGVSGSGKSTVALFLPRFYDISSGQITVDGTDIRDVTLASLRDQIGVVFEESFLFSDTVAANIAYGKPDASHDEVVAAARAAEAEEFIAALPNGYDTVVGERGMSLSGGQRQRIALARALLTDPRILILDDATSAVDSRVEQEIHATLHRVMAGRTTLLVAHRRSTLRLADRIAVVDGGRVVDLGTHDELTERSEIYRLLLAGPGEDLVDDAELLLAGSSAALASDETSDGRSTLDPELWTTADEVTPPVERITDGAAAGLGGMITAQVGDRVEPRITAGAWPGRPLDGRGTSSVVSPALSLAAGVARASGGGGGGPSGWMGALAPTPELMAKVAALPPADDLPGVDVAQEAAYDPTFTLRHFLRPFRRQLILGLVLVLLDAVATIAGPLLIRSGLDDGVSKGSLRFLMIVSVVFFAVTFADLIDSYFQVLVTGRTAERLLFSLRIRIWAHFQRLSVDFYDRELAGRLMTRMTTDVDALSSLLQSGLISALVALFTCAGVGVALLVWNWRLAAVTLTVVIPLAIATVAYRRLSGRAYGRARERIAVVNANMQESLSGVREAQAFGRQERNESDFRRFTDSYRVARLVSQRLVSLYFPFVQLLSDIAGAVVIGLGSVYIGNHSLSSGELVGFLLYLDLFFSPIQQLSQTFDSYQQAGASMAQINNLMAVQPSVQLPDDPIEPGHVHGRVTFDDVHFAYPGTQGEALRGLDLEIHAGETVALVGQTGAGKSTIIKLVTRFYDPTGGRLLIDGVDLRDLDLAAFRHRIGYVPQEAFLFSGTIRDNLAYGRPDATDAEVEAAARAVGAHDFIVSLPNGYLQPVSERGRSLSAGQRQLIALARAELVDPSILLLDEATSNLDLGTEAKVSAAMGVVASGRTTVLIAHRLQTAKSADRIVVMDQGRAVEQGTHDSLLAQGGFYALMWEAYDIGAAATPGT